MSTKRFLVVFVLLCCCFLGCDDGPGLEKRVDTGISVWTDEVTGCQYLSKYGALTPRLDVDGNPICSSMEQE